MPQAPFIRTAYNYDTNAASDETALNIPNDAENNRTKQEFKDESDINVIVDRFLKTGKMPEDIRLPAYADYEGIFDFQTGMNTLIEAENSFMTMPAQVRAKFENDPQQFLEFVTNPANTEELIKMGLANPKPPTIGAPQTPTTPPPAPATVAAAPIDKKPAT